MPTERPYRSHKVPACDLCRRRKIRCNVDLPNQPCRFCRERNSTCVYSQGSPRPVVNPRPSKRLKMEAKQLLEEDSGNIESSGLAHLSSVTETSPDQSSIFLNPPMAEDVQALERYLTSNVPSASTVPKAYSMISATPGKPIVSLSVPRGRKGLEVAKDPGRAQREVIEQVLGTHKNDVVDLYFEKLHPCFPIIDGKTFRDLWQREPNRISSTLVCDLFASTLHFWNTSSRLRQYSRPDLAFIWNQAVSAIQEDFVGPTISTVYAALLDLSGRPVFSITGNVVTLGHTVTLAHSLGLHRDPTSWKATENEKAVRIRLWYGVLIHDHWSSLAHGTPPLIQRQNYDVPMPDIETLSSREASEAYRSSSATFVYLCSLTRILGDVLPLVYALEVNDQDIPRDLRKLECRMDDWHAALPIALRHASEQVEINGSSSLYLCYLSTSLVDQSSASAETKGYRLAMLREAAIAVIEYTTSLTHAQLSEFWLCYVSHLLVITTTILLRCLLESPDPVIKHDCAARLMRFRDQLRVARDESDWDLADFCLERCSEPISKIAAMLGPSPTDDASEQQQQQHRQSGEALAPKPTDENSPSMLQQGPSSSFDFDTLPFTGLLDEFLFPEDSLLSTDWDRVWEAQE